ncbi:uncharacterized protein LOC110681115 isoform X2 [Aedes aegypti]|uniref:Uncharacterized protein n=1 Tax=Aedes aegypti TaxID=7159 RepID=A0A6I8U7M4_AEDAE|nr:uncharacterized protein LOC5567223 isoform X2 [Aedes aegypti]XP_021712576.1 uncharacterized protein LOC110681115 isoform X2 [Aedes aegypti]
MASESENIVEELFEVEVLLDQELLNLLKSFELSDQGIEQFLTNGYDIASLRIIEREEVEALLPPPFLADRTKSIDGLNKWRLSQGLQPVSQPLKENSQNNTSLHQNISTSRTSLGARPRTEWTAQNLICRSRKGNQILEKFKASNILSKKDRIFITHLIVDEFTDEFGKLTREELIRRSAELSALFPTTDQHIWYQPAFYRDASGKKIKLGRVAKGCLYDRNNNYLSGGAKTTKNLPGPSEQRTNSNLQLDVTITEDAVIAYQEITTEGYQLVKLDFQQKFPEKVDLLFSRFVDFRSRAQAVFANEVSPQGKPLCEFLLHDDLTEDSRDCITATLIFYSWRGVVMRLPNGTKWKPSLQEVCDSSIIFMKSLTDYETELARLNKQNTKRGVPDYPVIVVVGEDVKGANQFIVCFNDIAYKAETFLKAVDITFKIYKAYGIAFPLEATGPWQFIATYFYDFDLPEDRYKAKTLTLISMLRNHLPST